MSYEKQTWVTGEIVTADKLNHMEDGIAASGGGGFDVMFEITFIEDGDPIVTVNVSYSEFAQKIANGKPLVRAILTYEEEPGYFAECQVTGIANNDGEIDINIYNIVVTGDLVTGYGWQIVWTVDSLSIEES